MPRAAAPGPVAPAEPAPVSLLRPGRALRGGGRPPSSAPRLFLGAIGLAQAVVLGSSGLFGGFYDFTTWAVLSALSLVALAAALVVRPDPPAGPARLVAGGLLALLVLSAISLTWSDSVDRSWTEVNRLVFYLATFLLACVVLRPGRSVRMVAGVIGGAIGVIALVTLGHLVTGDTGSFLTFRLNAPVEYINGTACLMMMGIWPLVAYAEAAPRPLLAGLSVGLASIEGSLLVLTQSRAVIPGMLGSAVLMLALVPGRLVRLWALAAVAAGAALALPWTLAVYSHRNPAYPVGPSPATIAHAGMAIVVCGLIAGGLWALARELAARQLPDVLRRVPAMAAVCLLLAAPLAILALDHNPVATVRSQWRAFTHLQVSATSTAARFSDVGGYRYDLWRVAVDEFEQQPLRGVGAGSYGLRYYQLRDPRNPQTVRQPHSLELQMLAELGLPGLLALLAFVAGAGWAFARSRVRNAGLSVALGGTFAVWFLHTSVDWIYNMPGITGMALLAAAGLCALAAAGPARPVVVAAGSPVLGRPILAASTPAPVRAVLAGARRASTERRILVWTLAVLALVAVGAPSLVRQYLAQQHTNRAAAVLPTNPRTALRETQQALRLNDSHVEDYYTRAAAFARLDDYPGARDTLLEAVGTEPLNFVTWALLGDLATRRGDTRLAARAYARARALDPGDAGQFGASPPPA